MNTNEEMTKQEKLAFARFEMKRLNRENRSADFYYCGIYADCNGCPSRILCDAGDEVAAIVRALQKEVRA